MPKQTSYHPMDGMQWKEKSNELNFNVLSNLKRYKHFHCKIGNFGNGPGMAQTITVYLCWFLKSLKSKAHEVKKE